MDRLILTKKKRVAGNITDFNQVYYIAYYPKEGDMPDKIAFYNYLEKEENIPVASRSIYFSSLGQIKEVIRDLFSAYMFFWEKRRATLFPLTPEDKIEQLNQTLKEIRDFQVEKWRQNDLLPPKINPTKVGGFKL